jgi:hypothetical protein
MPPGLKIARFFLIAGGTLLVAGLLLWALLPIHFTLPPYLLTPLLALGYGAWCWRAYRTRGDN